ncbi:MAG: transposase [Steroidobacteraceae bacterium]|jgi:putative transposase|nr:transposase [Steroidobacteraceae bacterium]
MSYTEERIAYALCQAESGTPVPDICRQMGCSEASFYVWRKRYGQTEVSALCEMRQLRDERGRLKRLVAELTLDKHILREVVREKL